MKAVHLALALVFITQGCASASSSEGPADLLAHEVVVPKKYREGRANPNFVSSAERYITAYDQAWWACVEDFARDIDHVVTIGDRAGNGWPSFIAGYWDGHLAAEARVKTIKDRFGPTKAQAILKQALAFPG